MPVFKAMEYEDAIEADDDTFWDEVEASDPSEAASRLAVKWWRLWLDDSGPPEDYTVVVKAENGEAWTVEVHIVAVPIVSIKGESACSELSQKQS